MLESSRIGADEDINDYEGKTEEEINELIASKVRKESSPCFLYTGIYIEILSVYLL
jgi:hypothetical protein